MKNIKLVLFVAVFNVIGIGSASAQDSGVKTVFIRASEFLFKGSSMISVVDPEGKISTIPLNIGIDKTGENAFLIHQEIDKWVKQGFDVEGVSNSSGDAMIFSIFVLTKEEE